MKFQIKEIILWSRDNEIPPCRHIFSPGKLNIITGASKTGKSAVLPIIDYCLGSSKCSIPVGVIREKCAWFGILVEAEGKDILFAREEPGSAKQSTRMYVQNGEHLDIPEHISQPNANVEIVKRLLNSISRLPNIGREPGKPSYRTNPPSFRDLLAFTFQPQNIVANPNALFYRVETNEYKERLKAIFPFAFGLINAQSLLAQWEIKDIEQRLKPLEASVNAKQIASDAWKGEISVWIDRAKEYGIAPINTKTDLPWPVMLQVLQRISKVDPSLYGPSLVGIEAGIRRLAELRNLEESTSIELGLLRRRRAELQRLQDAIPAANNSLIVQKERLDLARWMKQHWEADHQCPLCGSKFESVQGELDELTDALDVIEVQVKSLSTQPESFSKEYERVGSQLRKLVAEISEIQEEKQSLEAGSKAAAEARYKKDEITRFIGQLQQALKTYQSLEPDSEIRKEIEQLRDRISALSAFVPGRSIEDRMSEAFSRVSNIARSLVPSLDAEDPEREIEFVFSDLTLKLVGDERDDYLWEIGSGANWLSYHLSMMVGFQKFFSKMEFCAVPSFLVLDQPSQVYFPRSSAIVVDDDGSYDLDWELDNDIQAVRRIFKCLSDSAYHSDGGIQFIVMDHASEEIWGDLPFVHKVGDWRNGKKLVPDHWPDR